MLIMRLTIAFGISAAAPLIGGAQVAAPPIQAGWFAARSQCEIALTEQIQPNAAFTACHSPRDRGPRLTSAVLKLPFAVAENSGELLDEAGQQAAAGSTQNGAVRADSANGPSTSTLPDAASSTRIALNRNTQESGGFRTPVAVYPIKFPYSPKQKFGLFVRDIYDPFNFMAENFNALLEQAEGTPHAYGGGGVGYGKRLGAMVGTDIVGEFTGTFLFPSIFHTDPRYFRMARGSLKRRFFYALSRQLITKSDSGDDTFNTSKLLSGIVTTTVSNSYYPNRDRSFPGIVRHTLINMGFDALNDSFREFWPDIAHGLHMPAFVIRRTADPTFVDPMDLTPMPMTPPTPPPATQTAPQPPRIVQPATK